MRPADDQGGFAIWSCEQGYDLTYTHAGVLLKTRWIAQLPDARQWQAWLEECGQLDTTLPAPKPRQVPPMQRPAASWQFHRNASHTTLNAKQIRRLALVGVAGLVLGVIGSVSLGLELQNAGLREQIVELRQQAGQAMAVQKQIDQALAQAQGVAAHAPTYSRLTLLAKLAATDMLGGKDKPFLVEWDDQNGRLRMQVAWPQQMRLDEFLSVVEQLDTFQDIKLMPNPPAGTVVIQAQVKP